MKETNQALNWRLQTGVNFVNKNRYYLPTVNPRGFGNPPLYIVFGVSDLFQTFPHDITRIQKNSIGHPKEKNVGK